jgi:type IV pilus assembly protein PilV
MTRKTSQRGFSLLEVLVALTIFSIGLIGLAGLLIVSVKTNHSAYLRSQASFLAQGMADRMRANSSAVWDGVYNTSTAVTALPTCPCSYTDVAKRDRYIFKQQLADQLPGGTGTIVCTRTVGGPLLTKQQILGHPPYDGLCSLSITWSESALVKSSAGTADSETFVWKFQP